MYSYNAQSEVNLTNVGNNATTKRMLFSERQMKARSLATPAQSNWELHQEKVNDGLYFTRRNALERHHRNPVSLGYNMQRFEVNGINNDAEEQKHFQRKPPPKPRTRYEQTTSLFNNRERINDVSSLETNIMHWSPSAVNDDEKLEIASKPLRYGDNGFNVESDYNDNSSKSDYNRTYADIEPDELPRNNASNNILDIVFGVNFEGPRRDSQNNLRANSTTALHIADKQDINNEYDDYPYDNRYRSIVSVNGIEDSTYINSKKLLKSKETEKKPSKVSNIRKNFEQILNLKYKNFTSSELFSSRRLSNTSSTQQKRQQKQQQQQHNWKLFDSSDRLSSHQNNKYNDERLDSESALLTQESVDDDDIMTKSVLSTTTTTTPTEKDNGLKDSYYSDFDYLSTSINTPLKPQPEFSDNLINEEGQDQYFGSANQFNKTQSPTTLADMESKKSIQVLKRSLLPFRSGSTGSTFSLKRLLSMNNNFEIAPTNPPPPVPNTQSAILKRVNGNGAPLIIDNVPEQKPVRVFASIENNNDSRHHEPLRNISNQTDIPRSLTNVSDRSETPSAKNKNVETKPVSTPAVKVTVANTAVKNNKVADDSLPELKLNGFVGFDSLPYQLVRKCHNNGFQFNLMCVGETGMGKTTLIESLFNMKVEFEPCNSELNTVELRTRTCEVCESGVRVKLRVVETAGFGDQLDKEKSAKVIVDYINAQFESYLKEELKIRRCLAYYDDTRIHACLYFISPTGHGAERNIIRQLPAAFCSLKALDVVTMRELSRRVNVIPVIAKADTACKDELVRFKQKIMSELKANNIEIYQFPTDDEAVRNENALLNSLLPFAIVGSVDFVTKDDGRVVRARRYPWGMVEVENEEHCDFVKLREAMLRVNEDSLRERTHNVLYERYRRQRLQEMKLNDGDAGPRMMEATLTRQKEFKEDIRKREDQFAKEFKQRINRKEAELKHREDALNLRQREIRERFEQEMNNIEQEITNVVEERSRLLNNSNNSKKQRK